MQRRDYLIGGATAAAVLGGMGLGSSAETLLRGGDNPVQPTTPAPGRFNYNAGGVNELRWRTVADSQRGVEMVFDWADPAPAFVRLTTPDGTEAAERTDLPDGGETAVGFQVPFAPGEWAISAEVSGQYRTLALPLAPRLAYGPTGLDRDTLVVTARNDTHTPNWVQSVAAFAGNQARSWHITDRVLPTDSVVFRTEWPFDVYRDVTVRLYDELRQYDTHLDLV